MEHVDQLRTMLQRLSRLNQALREWDRIDAQAALPAGERAVGERPKLGRQALRTSLIMLLADINRLDQEICASAAYSLN